MKVNVQFAVVTLDESEAPLIVSDVIRSLRFYRDQIGFNVVEVTPGSALIELGGVRIALNQVADMSPVERRVVLPHIHVRDLDAMHQDLRSKGVMFAHGPRMMSQMKTLELWAATFRDPDGHAIALTQWRSRR